MNDNKRTRERTERKRFRERDLVTVSLDDGASSSVIASPSDEHPGKRPSRACATRIPARLAPRPPIPLPKRPSQDKQPSRAANGPLAPSPAPSPAWKERTQLRSMWELASILNFFNMFRPILNLGPEFSVDELESALLSPNNRLSDIHVALLKPIPPASRIPLSGDTWVTVLCRKFKDWWPRVAEGPCPLLAAQGTEVAAYKELDAATRVKMLKALCEIRVDQDDTRFYIEESLKQGHPISAFRKDRTGTGIDGAMYWYEDDPILGQRLYREFSMMPKSRAKGQGRGRAVPPPTGGYWETVATNFEEFQEVAERLLVSRNRMEVAMGKRILSNIIPQLEEIQKKKERTLKKQQRQAMLLDNLIQGNGLAAGRSRRERKPVTYTFDEYDRSISEAIKFTKKRSPEPALRRDLRFPNGRLSGMNGPVDNAELGHSFKERDDNEMFGGPPLSNGALARRQLRSSQHNSDHEDLDAAYAEAAAPLSDDEIEGEAVYDDDYVPAKQRKDNFSFKGDEHLRGEEQEDAEWEGEEQRKVEDSEDEDGDYQDSDDQKRAKKQNWKGQKIRLVDDLQWEGVHRSKRPSNLATEYSESGDSDSEGERDGVKRMQRSGETDRVESGARVTGGIRQHVNDAESDDYSTERENGRQTKSFEHDRESEGVRQVEGDPGGGHSGASDYGDEQEGGSVESHEEEDRDQELESSKAIGKKRQMLDLNELASAGGGSLGNKAPSRSESDEDSVYSGNQRTAEANGGSVGGAKAGADFGSHAHGHSYRKSTS